jgi:hypothetical protein
MALDNSVANKTNHYYYLYSSSITEQNQRPKAVRRSDESERRDGYRHSDMPRPQSQEYNSTVTLTHRQEPLCCVKYCTLVLIYESKRNTRRYGSLPVPTQKITKWFRKEGPMWR